MKRVLENMRTLLVDGPAAVTLVSGDLGVLGAPLNVDETVVVRQVSVCLSGLRLGLLLNYCLARVLL